MAASIQGGNKLFPEGNRRDTRALYAACHRKPAKRRTQVKSLFKVTMDAFAAAREQRRRARLVEQLDERTLRDIGLEDEANRARARSRQVQLRFGMY
jgi:hypothetical protein